MATGTDIIARGMAANALGRLQSKADLVNGKVPSSQLPSYVDDVVEGYYHDGKFYEDPSFQTEIAGESGKIYIDLNSSGTYRYSGDHFYLINEPLPVLDFTAQEYATLLNGGTVNITGDRALTVEDKDAVHFRVTGTEFQFVTGKTINKNGVIAFTLLDYSPTQDIMMYYYLVFTPVSGGFVASIIRTTAQNGAQVNVLEGVSVDGTDLPILNKKVNIDLSQKQDVIDASNKLPSDYVDDTNQTNKFVTSSEKDTWNAKQDALTAGQNITIQNNVISAADATIGRTFTTDITVGHLQAGTEISANETVASILYRILYDDTPITNIDFYQYADTVIPATIDNTWTSQTVQSTIVDTGMHVTISNSVVGYLGFAYPAALGDLAHVYQNDLTSFDLLPDLTKSAVVYNGVQYYMYIFEERAAIASGDFYDLLWG